jgi:pimeloyl-ACP methyl ester carboxylesterase
MVLLALMPTMAQTEETKTVGDGGRAKSSVDSNSVMPLWIANGDRQIYGELSRPRGIGGRRPIAIVSHGFNGTHFFARDYYDALASLGWMTYGFDFPCGSIYSRSDNNTMNMSVLDEESDLRAVINYFRNCPDVNPDSIMLIGESQGGLVSALTGAQKRDEVCGMVLIYPALCIPDNWNGRYPKVKDIPDTTRVWGVPLGRRFFTELRGLDPFRGMKKFTHPVLILQGDADVVVSVDQSRQAAKTYPDARLHIIHGAGHGFKPQERLEAIEEIKKFIRKE